MTADTFLRRHIEALAPSYRVYLIANAPPEEFPWARAAGVTIIPVSIERRISPMSDLLALAKLVQTFRRCGFEAVHSTTPKAGLLSMTAAWLAGVPVRIHTFTGQVWATRRGTARVLLRSADRLMARLATHVLADSRSQLEFLVSQGVVPASKARVLGGGSISGVDGGRFRADEAARDRVRAALGIPLDAVVFLYLGRLARDKGVLDLASAFGALIVRSPTAFLMIVGPDEEGLVAPIEGLLAGHLERFRRVDYTERPEEHMAAADVFCLPSYREGFGQVAIEASAAELPVVASRIYGVTDAVVERETGLFHAPGDVAGLREAMLTLLEQPELRRRLGRAGRARALREFSAEHVTRALVDYYSELPL